MLRCVWMWLSLVVSVVRQGVRKVMWWVLTLVVLGGTL